MRKIRLPRRLLSAAGVVAVMVGVVLPTLSATPSAAQQSTYQLEQCANGAAGTPVLCQGGSGNQGWVTGDLNPQNSHWAEGDFVPCRAILKGLAPGPHTLLISYDVVTGGKHAFDYLGSFNATEAAADPCSDVISGCKPGAPAATAAIPTADLKDTAACGATVPTTLPSQQQGEFAFFGPVSSGPTASYTSQNAATGPGSGGCDTTVEVAFTVAGSGGDVVIAWGGHIASSTDWGSGNAASSISGSPYHMELVAVDGASIGRRDRQIQIATTTTTTTTAPSTTTTAPSTTTTTAPSTTTTAPSTTTTAPSTTTTTAPSTTTTAPSTTTTTVPGAPPAPILTATKSVSPASGSTVELGATLTYTVTLSNSGTGDATNVTVTDKIPAGTTYVPGSATGTGSVSGGTVTWGGVTVPAATGSTPGTVQLSFKVTVDRTDRNGQVVTNTAAFTNEGTPQCTTSTCKTDPVTNTVHVIAPTVASIPAQGGTSTTTASTTTTTAPSATTTAPSATTAAAAQGSGRLAFTGSGSGRLTVIGLLSIGLGVLLLFAGRRRPARRHTEI